MVHENFRWQPWYREIKRLQTANAIGHFWHLLFVTRTGDGWGERAYLDRQPFFRDQSWHYIEVDGAMRAKSLA